MMVRSIQLPAFHAATTPSGTATRMVRTSVIAISESVGSMRCAIIAATGRLVKIEVPRSPCRICQTQVAEPDQERPVEAEALANALDVGRARLVAGDHRRRIARRDVEQAEHEQRDDRHHGDGREDAPEDIREHVGLLRRHAVFDTPQKNGSGPFAMPETFLRHAV